MFTDSSNFEELQEYYSELFRIQDENATSIAVLLPNTEKIYNINLESRIIEKPEEFRIVESDKDSETIYFKCPRYFDNMDLTNTVCVIQYINARGEHYIYAVPYYDVDTLSTRKPEEGIDEPMIIIPWRIAGTAAAKSGTLAFAIRFYELDSSGTKLLYNLNTLQQTMTIYNGIGFNPKEIQRDETIEYLTSAYEEFLSNAAKSAQEGSLCWIVLD